MERFSRHYPFTRTAQSFEKQKVGLDVIFHAQSDALIRSIIVNMNAFCYEDMVSGWNLLDIGVPAHKGVGDKHLDTRDPFPMADWPYRSTFVKVEDKWILTEWCERLSTMPSLTAVIPEARMGPSTKSIQQKPCSAVAVSCDNYNP